MTTGPTTSRTARAAPGQFSNHSSATAIDINATQFPAKVRRMTQAQRDAVHRFLAPIKDVIEWGGDWSPAFMDEMHFQIRQGQQGVQVVTRADVVAAIKRVGLDAQGRVQPQGREFHIIKKTKTYRQPGVGKTGRILDPRKGPITRRGVAFGTKWIRTIPGDSYILRSKTDWPKAA